jgi:hypothetical protein
MKIFKLLKAYITAIRFKKACKLADKLASETNQKYLVLKWSGRITVMQRKKIKLQLRNWRFKTCFNKNMTIEDFDKIALYKTY